MSGMDRDVDWVVWWRGIEELICGDYFKGVFGIFFVGLFFVRMIEKVKENNLMFEF